MTKLKREVDTNDEGYSTCSLNRTGHIAVGEVTGYFSLFYECFLRVIRNFYL